MATTEIQTEACLKAGDFFLAGIKSLQNADVPLRILFYGLLHGDLVCAIRMSDLFANATVKDLASNSICHKSIFANLFGYLIIMQKNNLQQICARVMDKSYAEKVKAYSNRCIGLRTKGDEIQLQFHVSLVYELVNEAIARNISEDVASVIKSNPKKLRRGTENPSVTTYSDDKNSLRLVVTKTNDLRLSIENILETALNFFGITGKEVFVTSNYFNYEIIIKDNKK